jgi:hypothetical protein
MNTLKNAANSRSEKDPAEICINSWSVTHKLTQVVRRKWPSVWALPAKEHFLPLIREADPRAGAQLLDVGASDSTAIRCFLDEHCKQLRYFSLDVDRQTKQDFYGWEEVNRTFDIIVCSQVLEHLLFAEAIRTCSRIYQHLDEGGYAFFTVPNIFHPNRFLTDPTHVTPWSYDKLGGALLALGFEICEIVRYGDFRLKPTSLRGKIMRFVTDKFRPYFDLDFAPSICVVGRKPTSS